MANLISTITYLFLVLAICEPAKTAGKASFRRSARDTVTSILALASTLALPWSGVSFLTLFSRAMDLPFGLSLSVLWLPLIGAAMLTAEQRGDGNVGRRTIPLVSLAILVSSLTWFIGTIGVPGDLASVESLSSIFRLENLRNERMTASAVLFFAGVLIAFAQAGFEKGRGRALAAFSCSGFLVNVFVPVRTAAFGSLSLRQSIVADALTLFALTLFLNHLILPPLERWLATPGLRGDWGISLYFVFAGCYFLATALD